MVPEPELIERPDRIRRVEEEVARNPEKWPVSERTAEVLPCKGPF
jgi:hypothetical protein